MEMDCSDAGGSSSKGRSRTSVSVGLRTALASGAAVALVFAALGGAQAATQPQTLNPPQAKPQQPKQAKREQPKKPAPPKPLDMPLIEVSISKQQLTVFELGQPVEHSAVSTGMAGHLTPTGIFSVIGKEIFHRSNIYSGAPMPFMQRITWSGVAMHAGVLPGYPASHGCIRLPHEFAVKLFGLTRMGARVLVMPHEVPPVAFENAKLFTRPQPATDTVPQAILPAPRADLLPPVQVIRIAQSQTPSVMSDAVDAAAHALSGMAKPKAEQGAAAEPAQVQVSEPPAAPAVTTQAEKTPSEPAADAAKDNATVATQPADEANKFSTAAGPSAAKTEPVGGEASTGTVMVKPVQVTSPQPIEVQKSFEPARGPVEGARTFQPVPAVPAAQPAQVVPATVPAAPAAQPAQATQPAPAPEVKPAAKVAAVDEFYGPERPLRAGPITVFVSKKEGKLFVRKGFQPVFSWPVKFDHPELPLGTHLYTAVDTNPDGVSFRWQVVSVPVDTAKKAEKHVARDSKGRRVETVTPAVALPAASPSEALERIDIPPIALARISALMSKGAALIISDQGLGGETGTETDFIVLTR
jgi:lipoprotein-anchoring transpeptidase ErfK/SrfK